jgi:hypothetical protein
MMRNWAKVGGFAGFIIVPFVCTFLWAISYPPLPGFGVEGEHYDCRTSAERETTRNDEGPAGHLPSPRKTKPGEHEESKACRDERERLQKAANERGITVGTWILAFSTSGLFLARTGLWFFTYLLWTSTRRAVVDGEKAINVAREGNQISRESLIVDQRPWLSIESVRLIHPTRFLESGMEFHLEVTVKNFGKTPAQHVWTQFEPLPVNGPFKETEARFIVGMRRRIPIGAVLFPQDTHTDRTHTGMYHDLIKSAITVRPDGDKMINLVLFVAVRYTILGSPSVGLTYHPYDMRNIKVGLTIQQDSFIPLSRTGILPGVVE